MKLLKSALLASAAGFVAVSGAQAADMPVLKAEPVEYVKVCDTYGVGFFFIPGTSTCLRVSGLTRVEYRYVEPYVRNATVGGGVIGNNLAIVSPIAPGSILANSPGPDDTSRFFARGRINFDARESTEYGTLRGFVRLQMDKVSGSATTANLDQGFIQFAGFTVGRLSSFFDFYKHDFEYVSWSYQSDRTVNLFAYTASFGNGFSATLSVEDPSDGRRLTDGGNAIAGTTGDFSDTVGLFNNTTNYVGFQVPDIVGNLRVDQAWGSAQLTAAAHQLRSNIITPQGGQPNTNALTSITFDDEWGFAIQGGVKINLPMIAAGDSIWVQAAYADGAIDYLLGQGTSLRIGNTFVDIDNAVIANNGPLVNGALPDDFTFTTLEKNEGWSVFAGFQHFWTPAFRQAIYGSYADISTGGPCTAQGRGNFSQPHTNFNAGCDWNSFVVGTQLIWSPVRNLDIGLDVVYRSIDVQTPNTAIAADQFFVNPDDDMWAATLRIERRF